MATSELTRLLIVPAIVLAAALSLSGCANLPFFGNDSGSSNNSSRNDDGEDDEDDEAEEDDQDEADAADGACPQQFLDGMAGASERNPSVSDFSIEQLTPAEFEPAAISGLLDGGCLFTMVYEKDGAPVTMYEAYISGGEDVRAELESDLLADGFESGSEGFYFNADLLVSVYTQETSPFSDSDIEHMGLDFLGDEYIVLTAYTG